MASSSLVNAPLWKNAGARGEVSQRRCPEPVAVGRVAGDLLQAEVLVFPRAVKDHVAHPDAKYGAICGTPTTRFLKSVNISLASPATAWHVAHLALRKRAARLASRVGHGIALTACEPVDRRVRKRQRELELSDRESEHRKVDGLPSATSGKSSPNNRRYSGSSFKSSRHFCRIGSFSKALLRPVAAQSRRVHHRTGRTRTSVRGR